jgi:ABC-type dipeptide/oligopeptide/nickel transport system ATPase subunit
MKHDVIERLQTLLRDEGFTNLSTLRASHDVTISAAKGDTRLVTHISERVSVPYHAQPHDEVPDPSVIAVRPQVPGIPSDPVTGTPGRAAGSGLSKRR